MPPNVAAERQFRSRLKKYFLTSGVTAAYASSRFNSSMFGSPGLNAEIKTVQNVQAV
jgi:hypothetical protein